MKAIVNIGFRIVELHYTIKVEDLASMTQDERNKEFKNWELSYSNNNKTIKCKHTLIFKDSDEWQSSLLFDGRMIDFHYDYINRDEMDSKKNWGDYIFQGYEYIEGEPQLYEVNEVDRVIIKF